uniref:Uncharacterized protein n=1 Tax=Lygus hesperus TaxID=30085 RepID=A0A146M0G1_LYGHE
MAALYSHHRRRRQGSGTEPKEEDGYESVRLACTVAREELGVLEAESATMHTAFDMNAFTAGQENEAPGQSHGNGRALLVRTKAERAREEQALQRAETLLRYTYPHDL